MFQAGIIRGPRKVDYIGESLDTYLAQSKAEKPIVFCEPDCDDFINSNKCEVYKHHHKHGVFQNWLFALRYLYKDANEPWILICEDDIRWTPGALDTLLEFLPKVNPLKTAFVSLYCAKTCGVAPTGWNQPNLDVGWKGALCVCVPRPTAFEMISSPTMRKWLAQQHLDHPLGEFAKDTGKAIWAHMPTLIFHLGEESTFEEWQIKSKHEFRLPYIASGGNSA